MPSKKNIAVVAHSGKTFGGGLPELRQLLSTAGYGDPIWCEVPSSRKAPKAVRRAVKKGAQIIFVWGGDGMVQRCIDALADTEDVDVAILPAGTANLLATALKIRKDLREAVRIGLEGGRRKIDVGIMNGERFAVMAGIGFDGILMRSVSGSKKERLGRLAYLRNSLKALHARRVKMTVLVDGEIWFEGEASALLTGNIGTITGGLKLFPAASASDGMLEVGVVTATGTWQWLRVFSKVAVGHIEQSPFIRTTRGRKIAVRLARRRPYELDGGARSPTKKLTIGVAAGGASVRVPPIRAIVGAGKKRKRAPRARLPSASSTRTDLSARAAGRL